MIRRIALRHLIAALCIMLPLAANADETSAPSSAAPSGQAASPAPDVAAAPAAPAPAVAQPVPAAVPSGVANGGRPSPAAAASHPGDGAASIGKTLSGLVLVLGLIAGAAWLMKRTGMAKPGNGSVARVVGGVAVGNRERVVVVEVADQWIVVGVAPGRVNALAQLPRGEQVDPAIATLPAAGNFSAWLKQTIERRQPPGPA